MERIGIVASKMAKGNRLLYNTYVILLTCLLALLTFLITGTPIMLGLVIIGTVINGTLPYDFARDWRLVIGVCMIALTMVVGGLVILALMRNLKIRSFGKK